MDLYFLLTLLIVSTLPFLLFYLPKRNENRTRNLPPGPFKFPIIGNLHQLIGDLPHLSLQKLSNVYGPIMFLQLGSKPTLVISSADLAKQIFKTHDALFSSRPVLYAPKRLTYNCSDISFAPYGEHWREVRKLTVLELLSTKKVQSFRAVREEEVALLIALIESSEGPIDLSKVLLRLTNDVICRVAFGRKFGQKNGFHALIREAEELFAGFSIADFLPWLSWIHKIDGFDAKLEKNFQMLDELSDKIIEDHLDPKRTKVEVEDFVDVMLRVQREHVLKIGLTNNNIKGLIMDMFTAATGTSAATIGWTMAELIKNPTIMKKAQEEVRVAVGNKEMVEESDIPGLNYLRLTLKEALRLHPPVPLLIPRETTEKCVIQGYDIPAKTRVFINAMSIMKDARGWEKPEEFWPERFQDNPIDFIGQEYEYIPFGIGRRICPGMDFALNITELVLANLLHCFDWELPHGMERESVDMKEAFGMVMHKKIPLFLVAKRFNLCRSKRVLNNKSIETPLFTCILFECYTQLKHRNTQGRLKENRGPEQETLRGPIEKH